MYVFCYVCVVCCGVCDYVVVNVVDVVDVVGVGACCYDVVTGGGVGCITINYVDDVDVSVIVCGVSVDVVDSIVVVVSVVVDLGVVVFCIT